MPQTIRDVIIGLMVLLLSTGAGAAFSTWQRAGQAVNASKRIEHIQNDHEMRLRRLETGMAEVANDVKWIRSYLERHSDDR